MRWDVAGMHEFELRTARTTIRPWRTSEADVLLDIRRRPEVARWLGDPTPWSSLDQARGHLGRWAEQATVDVPSSCAIVPDEVGHPVGTVTLVSMPDPTRGVVKVADCAWLDDLAPVGDEVEVGWYLHPDHGGHGWATEAARAMLDHGLDRGLGRGLDRGLARIWACMWPDNASSAAVARRLGMEELGVLLDPWYGTADDPDSRLFLTTA